MVKGLEVRAPLLLCVRPLPAQTPPDLAVPSLRRNTIVLAAATLVCGIAAVAVTPAVAQDPPVALRTFDALVRMLPQATAADALQIRVRWRLDRAVVDPAGTGNRLDVLSVERLSPGPSRDRRPEVSSQHVIAISQNAVGVELDWRAIVDPRIVRSEGQSGGELRGETLYYLDAELVLAVPALPETVGIALYKIVIRNGAAALSPIGRVQVPPPPFP